MPATASHSSTDMAGLPRPASYHVSVPSAARILVFTADVSSDESPTQSCEVPLRPPAVESVTKLDVPLILADASKP